MKLKNIIYFASLMLLSLQNTASADVTASGNVVVYNAVLGSADPSLSESWSWFQLSGVDALSTCPTGDKGAGDLVYIALPESEKLASTLLLSAYGGGLELVAEIDDANLYQGYCRLTQLGLAPTATTGGSGGGGQVHQYWRISGVQLGDSLLEISEAELLLADNTSVNSLATITFSDQPNIGGSNITDGNLSTRGWWDASIVTAAGFYMQWDFGSSPQAVAQARQGGFDTSTRYMSGFDVQYSDDGVNWTTQSTQSGLAYPGNYTYSEYYDVSQ